MKKATTKKTRKVCPNCRSTYIGLWMGGDLGIKYICNECQYVGNIVIEEDLGSKNTYGKLKRKKGNPNKKTNRRRLA